MSDKDRSERIEASNAFREMAEALDRADQVISYLREQIALGAPLTALILGDPEIRGARYTVVQKALELKAEVNGRDGWGETALREVIREEPFDAKLAELLLKNKAAVNKENDEEYYPLEHAIRTRNADIVRLMLEYKAEVRDPKLLRQAVLGNNLQIVNLLLDAKANPRATDQLGQSLLHWAASMPQEGWPDRTLDTELRRRLLSVRADIHAKDYLGNTALQVAADKAQTPADLELIIGLLQAKADIRTPNNYGATVLSMLEERDHLDIRGALRTIIQTARDTIVAEIDNDRRRAKSFLTGLHPRAGAASALGALDAKRGTKHGLLDPQVLSVALSLSKSFPPSDIVLAPAPPVPDLMEPELDEQIAGMDL